MPLIFDIESDGLRLEATRIWCIVTLDLETEHMEEYHGSSERLSEGIMVLDKSDLIIGHNVCGFDVPLVKDLTGIEIKAPQFDTLLVSQLLNPDRRGGHSLDSWGQRLGRKKPEHEDWSCFSPEMLHRCKEDVFINRDTYYYLLKEMKK